MVLMTAILPPSQAGELWRRMGWDPDEVQLFRAGTTRSNIRYQVIPVEGREEVLHTVIEVVQ